MELTQGSETSANYNLTPGKYPKEHIQKIIILAPTCFGSRRNGHKAAVLCLAKTTEYGFSVLIGTDAVNVMAAYQPVVMMVPA